MLGTIAAPTKERAANAAAMERNLIVEGCKGTCMKASVEHLKYSSEYCRAFIRPQTVDRRYRGVLAYLTGYRIGLGGR